MSGEKGNVLVMGAGTRAFLSVIRSLGRAGINVHVAWVPADDVALSSRYITEIHHIPFYSPLNGAWLDSLKELLRSRRFDLVIPCDDTRIIPLQLHRTQLADSGTPIYLLEDYAHMTAADKGRTCALAQRLGVPVPRYQEARTIDEIHMIATQFGFPLLVKPHQSFTAADVSAKQVVRLVGNAEEISVCAPLMSGGANVLVQEYFAGVGVGVEVLCKNGEVLVAFQHERVHEPLLGGGSSYRKSARLTPELLQATARLASALRYTGVCMMEFRVNQSSGSWVLIEINGRFWGSLPLSVAAGVDFPRYLYEMICLGRTQFPQKYRSNIFCRNWLIDAGWFRANIGARRRGGSATAMPLFRTALELRHFALGHERSDTLVFDDPAPARHELRVMAAKASLSVSTRRSSFCRRMRGRMIAGLPLCQNILFVCKGNICRSPFAAKLLAQHVPRALTSSSVGFQPPGRPSPEIAIKAALEFGVDLNDHRSVEINREQTRMADIILVFDLDQAVSLRTLFPECVSKTMFVGAIDCGPIEIVDPSGKSFEEFISIYKRIEAAIRLMAAAIVSRPLGQSKFDATQTKSKLGAAGHVRNVGDFRFRRLPSEG